MGKKRVGPAMPRPPPRSPSPKPPDLAGLDRISRPLSLTAQVEQLLRQAIAEGRWAADRNRAGRATRRQPGNGSPGRRGPSARGIASQDSPQGDVRVFAEGPARA